MRSRRSHWEAIIVVMMALVFLTGCPKPKKGGGMSGGGGSCSGKKGPGGCGACDKEQQADEAAALGLSDDAIEGLTLFRDGSCGMLTQDGRNLLFTPGTWSIDPNSRLPIFTTGQGTQQSDTTPIAVDGSVPAGANGTIIFSADDGRPFDESQILKRNVSQFECFQRAQSNGVFDRLLGQTGPGTGNHGSAVNPSGVPTTGQGPQGSVAPPVSSL